MRKLILASRSSARKRLLRALGLKFKIAHADVIESHSLKRGCKNMVIDNALRKGKKVSQKLRSGIVISADTVVKAGKKIIGKPKSIKDAIKTLKLISRKPQWVCTGIVVIDVDNNKVFTDFEKTKVYMCPLSDEEIKRYFKKISPFEKAGSFDVQGPGSIFIDRVEGCFYNVVGLPLAKLGRILKKCGVDVL